MKSKDSFLLFVNILQTLSNHIKLYQTKHSARGINEGARKSNCYDVCLLFIQLTFCSGTCGRPIISRYKSGRRAIR